MQKAKPKQSAKELIRMMKTEKGIGFSLMSEEDAERYLLFENNYLRTASYRKNYQRKQRGSDEGKYINLEFEYLRELSAIDHAFRESVLPLCIDIEHDLKVKLVRDIENDSSEDGYSIVKEFVGTNPRVLKRIAGTATSPFTHDLMCKYLDISVSFEPSTGKEWTKIISVENCPIWVFVELLQFGDFIELYRHYYYREYEESLISAAKEGVRAEIMTQYEKRKDILSYKILNSVRTLRNGCAHNNCMLSNLTRGKTNPLATISRSASSPDIGRGQLHSKLSTRPMYEFACLLYSYRYISRLCNGHSSINNLIGVFRGRMLEHKEYFCNNMFIKDHYHFATHLIKTILPNEWEQYDKLSNEKEKPISFWNRVKNFLKIS